MNAVVEAKVVSLQRCVARAREEYAAAGERFAADYTRQDAAVLNALRACELAIDLANHLVRARQLGVPQTSRESFDLLARADLLPPDLAGRLAQMVSFRNLAVHRYTGLDVALVADVIEHHPGDLVAFADRVLDLDRQ